jgi:hypothetical protein
MTGRGGQAMLSRIVFATVAILGTATVSLSAEPAELSLELSADKTEVYLAEPLWICYRVTNTSNHDVLLPQDWWYTCFKGGEVSGNGKTIAWNCSQYNGPLWKPVETLRPGEFRQACYNFLSIAAQLGGSTDGTYQITGTLKSDGVVLDKVTAEPIPCWKGVVSAQPLKIIVKKPPTAADEKALRVLLPDWDGLKPRDFREVWSQSHNPKELTWKRLDDVIRLYPNSVYVPYCQLYLCSARAKDLLDKNTHERLTGYLRSMIEQRPAFRLADQAEVVLSLIIIANNSIKLPLAERQKNADKAKEHLEHSLKVCPFGPAASRARQVLDLLKKFPWKEEEDFVTLLDLLNNGIE